MTKTQFIALLLVCSFMSGVVVFGIAGIASAAITVGDTETSGGGNSTTLDSVVVDSGVASVIIMQAASTPGVCTRNGQTLTLYDTETNGDDAYDANLLYLETPNVGSFSIDCENSVGLTAAVFESDAGSLTFTGIGKDFSDTSPGSFDLDSVNNTVKVGVMGFSQTTWSCSAGCTAINSGSNRGGVIYTPQSTTNAITIAQSSLGMSLVFGELAEGEGGGEEPESTTATSSIDQTQQNLGIAFLLYIAGMFFVVWFFKKRS